MASILTPVLTAFSILVPVVPAFVDDNGFVANVVCSRVYRLVSSGLCHRLVRFFIPCNGGVVITLSRVFVVTFWLTSHLISFIPIYERDIPLSDESINHKHTHEQ